MWRRRQRGAQGHRLWAAGPQPPAKQGGTFQRGLRDEPERQPWQSPLALVGSARAGILMQLAAPRQLPASRTHGSGEGGGGKGGGGEGLTEGGGGGLTEGGGGEGLAEGGGGGLTEGGGGDGLTVGGGGLGGLGGGNAGGGGDGDGGGKGEGEGGLGDGLWQKDATHNACCSPAPGDLFVVCRHAGTARHTGNVFRQWARWFMATGGRMPPPAS